MPENELFIWLGFLTLFISLVLLWYITRQRKEKFSPFSQRELAVKERTSNIIYISLLTFISGFLVLEIATLSIGWEDSMSELFSFQNDENLRWPYILVCFAVLCFAIFAAYNEFLLFGRMIDAKRKLLLGELTREEGYSDSVETSTPPQSASKAKTESSENATFAAVIQAMDLQLKQAVQAAEDLKTELDETKEKVVALEIEVQDKNSEIKQIKESKSQFNKMMQESSEPNDQGEGKSLSLTDSVMVGDFIKGGVKIDKQINNDPEAIARAVIEAFRAGREDK